MPRATYVAGVGITPFGKFPDQSLRTLGRAAALDALKDSGLSPQDIEVLSCGTARSGILHARESGVGQMIGWELGINEIPVYNVKAYCASGSSAFNLAHMAVAGGFHDVALVVGVEKMSSREGKGRPLTSDGVEIEGDLGFTPPVFFAASARRHMEQYGTTREQMAMVAVKNRRAAAHNPIAQYKDQLTVEQVLSSRSVVWPLSLYDCCPTGDGAAATVIMSEDAIQRFGTSDRAVRVSASLVRSGQYEQVKDLATYKLDVETARLAYEQAALGPRDVSVAEVHDAFTIAEIIHYEDLGFCEKGEGGRLVEDGVTALGGSLPVSPSGGLLTKGHPLGATGVAQIVELTEQLRGRSGQRQVEDARVGLAHVSGGFLEGDLATSTVTILQR